MVKKEKRAEKRKLKGKESFSNIYMVYMTLSHQNEARKAKIKNFREGRYCVKGAKKRKYN